MEIQLHHVGSNMNVVVEGDRRYYACHGDIASFSQQVIIK